MANRVFLLGNLGADPELRRTNSGEAVMNLRIATTEVSGSGEDRKKQTEWHKIVIFGKTAENCNKFLSKGSQVYIEGKIRTRTWQGKDEQAHCTTEILADHVEFTNRHERTEQAQSQERQDEEAPF